MLCYNDVNRTWYSMLKEICRLIDSKSNSHIPSEIEDKNCECRLRQIHFFSYILAQFSAEPNMSQISVCSSIFMLRLEESAQSQTLTIKLLAKTFIFHWLKLYFHLINDGKQISMEKFQQSNRSKIIRHISRSYLISERCCIMYIFSTARRKLCLKRYTNPFSSSTKFFWLEFVFLGFPKMKENILAFQIISSPKRKKRNTNVRYVAEIFLPFTYFRLLYFISLVQFCFHSHTDGALHVCVHYILIRFMSICEVMCMCVYAHKSIVSCAVKTVLWFSTYAPNVFTSRATMWRQGTHRVHLAPFQFVYMTNFYFLAVALQKVVKQNMTKHNTIRRNIAPFVSSPVEKYR